MCYAFLHHSLSKTGQFILIILALFLFAFIFLRRRSLFEFDYVLFANTFLCFARLFLFTVFFPTFQTTELVLTSLCQLNNVSNEFSLDTTD